jgi:hypothetical protein
MNQKFRLDIPVDATPSGHHATQLVLEQMLLSEPQEIVLAFGSRGPMDAYSALGYTRLLQSRDPLKTRLITLARGGLFDNEALIWLQGDERDLPADSWLCIRSLHVREEACPHNTYPVVLLDGIPTISDPGSSLDQASVLEKLNEYIPVAELVGRPITGKELEDLALCGTVARALDSLLSSLSAGYISGGLGRHNG